MQETRNCCIVNKKLHRGVNVNIQRLDSCKNMLLFLESGLKEHKVTGHIIYNKHKFLNLNQLRHTEMGEFNEFYPEQPGVYLNSK